MRASRAHRGDLRAASNAGELTSSPEMGHGSPEAPSCPIGYIPAAVYQKTIIDAEHRVLICCLK
jgi:hypothetical protein